jgi:hypothetical protein
MIPPILITLRTRRIWLPLPVIVLWPLLVLLAVLAVVVLPFVRIRGTTLAQRALWPIAAWRGLAATRGLVVDVDAVSGDSVSVRCY